MERASSPHSRLGSAVASDFDLNAFNLDSTAAFQIFQLTILKPLEAAMGMELMARYSLPEADRADSARSADILKRRGPADRVEVLVVRPDGTQEVVALPQTAAGIIGDILEKISGADQVALLADDAEVSPEDAAAILGISRPLVRRRMDAGVLPFRRVGAHRRLRLSAVLDLQRREAPIRAALDDLQADTDTLVANGL
jgi:excisionase family DNA binding protein